MRVFASLAVALLVAAPMAAPMAAQEVHRVSGTDVAIYNLAGHVEIVRGSGSDVVVRVTRGGRDAGDLEVRTGTVGGRETLRVVYPSDQIVYPAMGRGSNTNSSIRPDGTWGGDGDGGWRRRGGDRVEVRGSGRGMEAWADLVIEVPAGRNTAVYLLVGAVEARDIDGDLDIDTGSGKVAARDIQGSLSIDTGSGSATVTGVRGSVTVDTGSGSIEVRDLAGDEVSLDTGSGRVHGTDISASVLRVDTGSGGIDLQAVRSARVWLDTGSGSVDIELMTDIETLEIDTGSGSVTVRAPADLGASVEIETGSGGIDLDFPVEVRSVRRDMLRGQIGDGRGEIVIDTGSGGIRILRTGVLVR